MEGKVAIVTGASRGLGRAIAELMGDRGAHLVINAIRADGVSDTVAALRSRGHEAVAAPADLATHAGCRAVTKRALDAYGRIDVLVNNAGNYAEVPIEELSDADWNRMFDVNLRSAFHMMAGVVGSMRAQGGGRIVNIASTDGYIARPALAHYAAAKAGVISLTKSFAEAYGSDQIYVNAVAPGPIATARAEAEGWLPKQAKRSTLGRVASPQDIAEVVCFLASDLNRCITGETVIASCGLVMI